MERNTQNKAKPTFEHKLAVESPHFAHKLLDLLYSQG